MADLKKYEVYFCYYKGVLVYIGKGKSGRNKHCTSGISHVYKLNEIVFKEGKDFLNVKVVKYFDTNKEACDYERSQILKYKPKFNSVYINCNRTRLSEKSRKVRKEIVDYANQSLEYRHIDKKAYEELVDEFINYFGYDFMNEKDFVIRGRDFYRSIGSESLRSFSIYMKKLFNTTKRINHNRVFYNSLKSLYNLDLLNHI